MADENLDRLMTLYPYLFDEEIEEFPADIGGSFIHLQVQSCNGIYSTCFSEAEIVLKAYGGRKDDQSRAAVTDVFMYWGTLEHVIRNPVALKSLGEFYSNEQHTACLHYMKENSRSLPESSLQTILAVHLFGPLMPESKVIMDSSRYKGQEYIECPNPDCNAKVKIKNTSFGNSKVWYGKADIVLDYSVVKLEKAEPEETDTDMYCGETLETSYEPEAKKLKLILGGGDAGSVVLEHKELEDINKAFVEIKTFKDSYMPAWPEKIPIYFQKANKTLAQVLSQTIGNAFLQVKKNPKLTGCFIPSFLATDDFVTIHMYNPTLDYLITSDKAMPLWLSTEPYRSTLNKSTILSIWFALNLHNHTQYEEDYSFFPESNLHKVIGQQILELYRNHMEMPLQGKPTCPQKGAYKSESQQSVNLVKARLEKLKSRKKRTQKLINYGPGVPVFFSL